MSQRPLSPLVDTGTAATTDSDNNNVKANPASAQADTKLGLLETEEDDLTAALSGDLPSPSPKKSPDNGEFRARAASAGQQARAHVSQIVARFRNRSNTSAEQDKERRQRYKLVTHVS